MSKSFLQSWVSLGAGLVLLSQGAGGNEALDLLEGKITDDEVTVTELLKERELKKTSASPDEKSLRDDRDYSSRWKNRLAPLALVYDNEENPVVQRIAIDGLAEWGLVDGEVDPDSSDAQDVSENRLKRLRLGGLIRAFYNTDLEGRVVADDEGYQGIDTLKATVQVNDALTIETGKFRPPFSQEYRRDPNVRFAPGLSPIVTQIAPANTLGIRFETSAGPWGAGLGWFVGDQDRNLPSLQGGGFALANLSYDFSGEALAGPGNPGAVVPPGHQRWHLDYLYNTSESQNGSVPLAYRHLLSTGIEVSTGRFDFGGDFLLANGDDNNAWGLILSGRYWLLQDAIRLTGRYSYADTDEPGGLLVGFGVPGAIGDTTQPLAGFSTILSADELHSFYLGLDWHLLHDYLTFTTGLEYRLLTNELSGDSADLFLQTGARLAF